MIDLSTIMVVWIWWLPMTVMWSQVDWNDQSVRNSIKFLKTHTIMDLSPRNNTDQDVFNHTIVFSCGDWDIESQSQQDSLPYFAPCLAYQWRLVERWSPDLEGSWLHFLQQISRTWHNFSSDESVNITMETLNPNYCVYDGQLLEYQAWADINDCAVYQTLLEGWTEWKKDCPILWDLMQRATETTGPLYTIYWSLLAMPQIALTTNFWNVTEISLELLMKSLIGLWMIIPLLILAAVMVIRTIVLWLVIAFSPLLVLAYSFKFSREKIENLEWWKFSLNNIVWLIFLPVFAVFALSISVVFLSLLSNVTLLEVTEGQHPQAISQPSWCANNQATILSWITHLKNEWTLSCYDFMGIQTVCFDEWDKVMGTNIVNILSWLVLNMFGIAIMWMVILFVLKGNKFSSSIATSMSDFAKQGLMSVPIIPIDTEWNRVSVWWAKDFVSNAPSQMIARQSSRFEWLMQWRENQKNAARSDEAKNVLNAIKENPSQFFDWSQSAIPDTNLWDYNDMTKNIAWYINQKQPNQTIKSDITSTSALINDKNFWKYVDSQNNWDAFTEWFMNNWVKTTHGQTRAEWSKKLSEWLMQWVPKANKITELNSNWSKARDYIIHNNKLKFIQWNSKWNEIIDNWVKVYTLPEQWLGSWADLSEFIRLANDAWWVNALPNQIYTQYLENTIWNNTALVDQLQNVADWQSANVTVWNDTVNVTVEKQAWTITWLQITQ